MAIRSSERVKAGSVEKELEVIIDNGDLQLIDSLADAYSFKDRDSLLKFAIGALLQGNNDGGIYTIKTGEESRKILSKVAPSADLLKPKGD